MKTLDPFEGLDDDDIRIAIANANGPRSSLFVPGTSLFILLLDLMMLLPGQIKMSDNVYEFKMEMVISTVSKPLFILNFGHFILSR